ncbi:hypothetical protein K5G00_08845 [Maribellus maritimus]|nr:hypothetical protein [Maribellus maritimus]
MIRLNKTTLLFCFILFFHVGNTQNLFNTENLKKFAAYLQNTRQYDLAASEYERILSITPYDVTVYPELLTAYRLGNNCQNSFQTLETLKVNRFFENSPVASEYLKLTLTCNCCYEKPLFTEALSSLDATERAFYQLGHYIFSKKEDALISFTSSNADILNNNFPDIFSNALDIQMMKEKSPFVAASMSAIIPGSGKAYSGYWGDAVMSLLFVSTNAWLSYQGFKKKGVKSITGWIFGSISFGFYTGNIWGSAKAAKNRNTAAYNKLYNEAKNNYYKRF